MEKMTKGVLDLINLSLETFQPHYNRLSEKQKSEIKKLEECRELLLKPSSTPQPTISLPISNVQNIFHEWQS